MEKSFCRDLSRLASVQMKAICCLNVSDTRPKYICTFSVRNERSGVPFDSNI